MFNAALGLALDPRHKSHNIPGKFVTYMQNGLPILANVNVGNDIAILIRKPVGQVCETNKLEDLVYATERLTQIESDNSLSRRCRCLFDSTVDKVVRPLISALTKGSCDVANKILTKQYRTVGMVC